jgi:hypothetical protein
LPNDKFWGQLTKLITGPENKIALTKLIEKFKQRAEEEKNARQMLLKMHKRKSRGGCGAKRKPKPCGSAKKRESYGHIYEHTHTNE